MRRGFTLIEIIIVITILGLMASLIMFNNLTASLRSGRDSKRKQDLYKLTQVMEDYYNDNGSYPQAGPDGTINNTPWGGPFAPYTDRLPQDPKSPVQNYLYQTDSSGQNYFALYAKLENTKDSDIEKVGCENGCGPGLAYSYVVHSTNIIMLAGLPQVPGGSSSTPTPEPPTPTEIPAPTPTSAPPTPTPTLPTSQTVSFQVNSSSNDAEEAVSGGSVSLTSGDLELVTDGTTLQTVGLRFMNVNIPQGAIISNSYLEFEVDEVQSEVTSLTFYGQAADNPPTFTTTTGNISGRVKTSSNVAWNNIPAWDTIGVKKQTPNLSPIISEIISRPGWVSGNSMVIIITGSGHRTAKAYDGSVTGAAKLVVTYI